ncbi:HEAT repeat domain-containing protein [Cyanobium sp. Alchichica 3B3-8F6]|uniref:HEAT repeat domain-containing protein n=1 Tax=Synechococcales TaxID=1890424 RepID=UPI00117D1AAE|nr:MULTISPECIES: HEAT repeat domain-containing protein [Synechococcales]MCP9882973.1 HEAT repeat domain-containing protein [Cyanobium sp. Alchichica 3B3-8F6]MCP9942151.1 HEAT repeat domain-containing protein [Cyanobium sp. ATX 6E8]
MPPSLLTAVAAIVAASFWLLARRRPTLGLALDSQAVAALNRAQIALVAGGAEPAALTEADGLAARSRPLPMTARERALFLRALSLQLGGPARERLAAIEAAGVWGQRASLPLLARGLRDVDPAVVQAAARAMERFRGRTCGSGLQPPLQLPLPRNVARTR